MKNILLVLTMLLSADAFASPKDTKSSSALGPEWQMIGSIANITSKFKRGRPEAGTCASRVAATKSRLFAVEFKVAYVVKDEYRQFSDLSEYYTFEKLETNCSEVAYVISEGAGTYGDLYTHIQLYCKPRPYSDIVIMSLYKNCVNEPKQECFQPNIVNKLDSIKSTLSKDVWSSTCAGNAR